MTQKSSEFFFFALQLSIRASLDKNRNEWKMGLRGGQLCVLYACDIFALTLSSTRAGRSDLSRKCLVALLFATHTYGPGTEEKYQYSVRNTNALCCMVLGYKQACVHLCRGSLGISCVYTHTKTRYLTI